MNLPESVVKCLISRITRQVSSMNHLSGQRCQLNPSMQHFLGAHSHRIFVPPGDISRGTLREA